MTAFWGAVLGVMDRLVLSDAAWERIAPLIIGRPDQKGSTGRDNRMFVDIERHGISATQTC
jgi:putative transposase